MVTYRILLQGIGLFFIITVAPGSFAAMYKWVDAEGNVQYTQSPPPPGVEGETIQPPPSVDTDKAVEGLQDQQQRADEYLQNRQQQKQESGEKEQDQAQKDKLCEQAKARLASYERPRVNYVDADGTRKRASEEERQAEIKKSQEYIDKYCN